MEHDFQIESSTQTETVFGLQYLRSFEHGYLINLFEPAFINIYIYEQQEKLVLP